MCMITYSLFTTYVCDIFMLVTTYVYNTIYFVVRLFLWQLKYIFKKHLSYMYVNLYLYMWQLMRIVDYVVWQFTLFYYLRVTFFLATYVYDWICFDNLCLYQSIFFVNFIFMTTNNITFVVTLFYLYSNLCIGNILLYGNLCVTNSNLSPA